MAKGIDLGRGVIKRVGGGGRGIAVIMYKDQPGVFYGPDGSEVNAAVAASVGFRVEALIHERRKAEAMKAALAEVEKRFARERYDTAQAVEQQLDAPDQPPAPEPGEVTQTGANEFEVSL